MPVALMEEAIRLAIGIIAREAPLQQLRKVS
jgi:hypothetical protein